MIYPEIMTILSWQPEMEWIPVKVTFPNWRLNLICHHLVVKKQATFDELECPKWGTRRAAWIISLSHKHLATQLCACVHGNDILCFLYYCFWVWASKFYCS